MSAAIIVALDSDLPRNPVEGRTRRRAFAVALVLHAVVLLGLVEVGRLKPAHIGSSNPVPGGIEAFVIPSHTSVPAAPKPTAPKHAPKALESPTKSAARDTTNDTISAAPQPAAGQGGDTARPQPSAPIRLGPGDHLGLVKKVDPIYPALMQTAGVRGTVVLDAVIHRDGSIGDITIVKSPGPAFERAAIDAVKQWRYTPLPYEGIVTVTLNFSLRT
jgi:TonB family protein